MNPLGRGALALALLAAASSVAAETLNGFDLSGLSVERSLVQRGGPPRDGIPALIDPAFVSADQAGLNDDDRVIGVAFNGEVKAYPLSIMNWHEVVNDRFGNRAVLVTYCPLCFTGMTFLAESEGERQLFGVSGLLYNSDVLLYDRATESLWSQISQQAVSGPRRGDVLPLLPSSHTTWGQWRQRHPDTRVLSEQTGFRRDYDRDPYGEYAQRRDIMFPVAFRARGYHPKEPVLGIRHQGVVRAYPRSELAKMPPRFTDELAGDTFTVLVDDDQVSARIADAEGNEVPTVLAYWFAWYAFHPDTEVFTARR